MTQLLWLALLLSGVVSAAGRCTLSAVPQQIAAEGVAESAGNITIACSGATPGRVIEGSIAVSFGKRVANRLTGDVLDGPVVEMETGPDLWIPFESRALLSDTSTVGFENLRWTVGSTGAFTLRLRGFRIAGGTEAIQAVVRFMLNERMDVATPLVTVAQGSPALMASTQATLATRGPSPPDDADFAAMVRLGSPFAAIRLSEGFPGAFSAALNTAATGTRFLVRFAGVTDGAKMVAPDVVVGSTGLAPTRSGGFGGAPGVGLVSPFGGRPLVLIRLVDAEINGQGGRLAANPMAVSEALGRLRPAGFSRGTPFLVYEVSGGDAALIESVEIPAWVAVPPRFDTPFGESVVRASVLLAPVSENEGAHPTAPIPRFRPITPGGDCELLSDCGAGWFPRMRLVDPSPLTFTALEGSGVQVGYAGIRNEGGGLLEWRASVRSKQSAAWLSVAPGGGVQNGGVRFDINPGGLAPGDYQAELAFEQIAPPTGRRDERVYALTLKVTPAPVRPPIVPPPPVTPPPVTPPPVTPPPPTPVIRDVVVGPARLGGPFAPSSILVVAGSNLGVDSSATVGGVSARILTAAAGEIAVVIPETMRPSRVPLVVTSNGNQSMPWFLDLLPAAPVALFALNADGDRNAEPSPARRGQAIDVYVTGIPVDMDLILHLHDRTIPARSEDGGAPGVRLVRAQAPADLPAMQTTAVIAAGGVSSHPLDIWIR